jgi:peptidoglycan/xylan/chitin deacetylase (PgdA/CDA1 family)
LAAPVPQPVVVPRGRLAPVYYRVPTSQPVVFLTIDDGWVRDPRLPALLTTLHVPVTIFLIRQAAAADVGYFRALQAAGATIEDHTLTHPFLTRLSAGAQSAQICGGADALAAWYGSRPTLVRPPYGAFNSSTQMAAGGCGLKAVVQWSASMYHGVLTVPGNRLHPGDIVILHFNDRLVSDLQQVVTMAAQLGLAVGRLESYLS